MGYMFEILTEGYVFVAGSKPPSTSVAVAMELIKSLLLVAEASPQETPTPDAATALVRRFSQASCPFRLHLTVNFLWQAPTLVFPVLCSSMEWCSAVQEQVRASGLEATVTFTVLYSSQRKVSLVARAAEI